MALDRKALRPLSSTHPDLAFTPEGMWMNELGSSMSIEHFDGASFSGIYESAVSENGSSVRGELTGTLAGDAIAFLVNWRSQYSSVTAWSGLVMSSGEVQAIYTLWHLANTPESEADAWRSIEAGSDVFVRVD